ncbi:hypothetical protein LSH36_489g01065 [Paralvinella palmiformis]|uniref:Uncharacterized protein n=1 Tax=Paralvinella palmiformis TaxID=53620 RepID=A0AAD9J8T9_9ANNE|nr:hypothetical protein LSH36_489g01065 [Paralvinella palmiformis]
MVDFEELDNFRRQWKNDLKTDLYVSEDRQSVKNVVVSESPHSPNELDSHNDVRSNSNILDPHPDRSNESGESCYCPKNDKFDPTSTGDKKLSHAEEMGNISKPAKFRKILTREERKSVENKNKFKPFLIAEMLLEGVSGQDSVHKMDHDEDKVRELFIKDRNKKLKLCSSVSAQSDSGTEKNRSFLDIFLADLVTAVFCLNGLVKREFYMKYFYRQICKI